MPRKLAVEEASGGRRRKGEQKRVLVGVRVPEDFHRRIESELIRRDLSLQEMVMHALTLYFNTPLDWDYAATTYVRHGNKTANKEVAQRNVWIDLWLKYIERMPREEIEVHARAMEWALRTLKSSRRKPTWRKLPGEKG